MDSNTKQLMAVFSMMLGISWGIPYLVSEPDERNAGWLMLAVVFILIAILFYLWIMREDIGSEEAASKALDAAEENLKKLEAQATEAEEEVKQAVEDRALPPQQAAPDIGLPQTSSQAEIDDALEEKSTESSSASVPVSDDDPSPEDVEVIAEDAQDGDIVAELEIADEMAAPDTPPEPEIEMDNDTAADSALASSHSSASDEPDDLERIEGIGPKYAEILTGAGITTFEQIAAMSADEIVDVIKSNGGRKSASMATWAEQAKLAAAGDWDALTTLQDELSGGRRS